MEPNNAGLAHVTTMPQEGDQGDSSGYAGKAAAAAASSEALAEAVAAAIAESSPKDGGAATQNSNALTSSAVPLNGDRSIGGASSSGGGTLDPKAPLSPVKNNHLDFAAPRGDGTGVGPAASPKPVAAAQSATSVSAPAIASMQREKTELAAAGLLLYGARGQGGGSSSAGVDNGKVREGQENLHQS